MFFNWFNPCLKWSIVLLGSHSQFYFLLSIIFLKCNSASFCIFQLSAKWISQKKVLGKFSVFTVADDLFLTGIYVWVLSNIHQVQNLFSLISQQIQISLFLQMSSLKSGIWRTSWKFYPYLKVMLLKSFL